MDIAVDLYPTDHRGVASTFVVAPAEPAPFAAPQRRRLSIGDTLSVVFHGGDQVALACSRAGDPVAALPALADDGTVTFPTAGLRRGHTRHGCSTRAGVVSRALFWLYRPGERTEVRTSKRELRAGRADPRLLVERARHALGLGRRLPREGRQGDAVRNPRVQRRLLR